jgi:hypothetical protein
LAITSFRYAFARLGRRAAALAFGSGDELGVLLEVKTLQVPLDGVRRRRVGRLPGDVEPQVPFSLSQ